MRNQTPLVPGQPAVDVTVHIVLNYFGSRLGRTYCEYEADQETIIESILNGQYSHPIRVVAFSVPCSTEPGRTIVQLQKVLRRF